MVEIFAEHVDQIGEPFKNDILAKALSLKKSDYNILDEFVSFDCYF